MDRRPLPFEVPRPVPVLLRNLEPEGTAASPRRRAAPALRLPLILWLLLSGLAYYLLVLRG
ncbi:hypothetical protein [Acidisoma sp. C75]